MAPALPRSCLTAFRTASAMSVRDGVGGFLVHANHLLMGGDHPGLGGGGTAGVGDQAAGIDAVGAQSGPQVVGMGILTGNAKQAHAGAQGRQVRGGIPRPARLERGALLADHRHRRFGRQARGLPPPIPVQNHVAQDQNPLSGELFENVGEPHSGLL